MYMLLAIAATATALKVLLIPTYHSTDFEVHRNWLAITHTLPCSEWYTDATSEWTLDYPPLFAWLERTMALAVARVYPQMLHITREPYYSDAARTVQRASVIALDTVLLGAAYWHARTECTQRRWVPFVLVTTSAGLLIVDHIHFQYNGVLLGVLLASCVAMGQRRILLSAALFSILLNLKHLYLVLAPVYFVVILRGWCWGRGWPRRLCTVGALVICVYAASLGPFVAMGQAGTLLSRLFPFGRGLLHAYWASNVWAVYAATDKALAFGLARAGYSGSQTMPASLTGGLVQVAEFAVLPQISPLVCALCIIAAMMPCLVALWRRPALTSLHRHVAYAALCGFLFGYHVHEKAALTVTVPLALGAASSRKAAGQFVTLTTAAHFALHPLLYEPREYPIKMLLISGCAFLSWAVLDTCAFPEDNIPASKTVAAVARRQTNMPKRASILTPAQKLYLLGLLPLELGCVLFGSLRLSLQLPFVPLMLTSLYCSVGLIWVWFQQLMDYVF